MPFEPSLPGPYQYLFHGHMDTVVTDPQGTPGPTTISMVDDWHLTVNWQVHGVLVPSIGGKWIVQAYLESIGPGPEALIARAEINMTGKMDYSHTFFIRSESLVDPKYKLQAGAYKLVTVITSLNLLGTPAPFAAYDEGPILQLFEGPALP